MRVLNHYLANEYDSSRRSLAVYRIIFAFLFLALYIPQNFRVGALPDSFYWPPVSPALFFLDGYPPVAFLQLLDIIGVVLAMCLLVGYRTRVVSILLGVMYMVYMNFVFSTGKIDHSILFLLTPIVLAGSGWGDHYSIDAKQNRVSNNPQPAASLAILALIVGFAMFTAGFMKFTSGWLALDVQSTQWHFFRNLLTHERDPMLANLLMSLEHKWLWEAKDWATVLVEMLALPAAFSRRLFRFFLAVLALFHIGVLVSFDIGFVVNVTVYGAFVSYVMVLPAAKNQQAAATTHRRAIPNFSSPSDYSRGGASWA